MSLSESLRTYAIDQSGISTLISTRMHESRAVQGLSTAYPFAVYFRRSTELDDDISPVVGEVPFRQWFDVECVSNDIDESDDLASAFKASLNNYRGSLGDGTVQAIFVQDHDDTYQPRIQDEDGALFVAALQLEIVGYTES